MALEVQHLGIGELSIAHNPSILSCVGLGSCLAITLYCPSRRVGGMAHAMLPRKTEFPQHEGSENPAKFVDSSLDAMVQALLALGAPRGQLVAKVVGGAQMFSVLASRMDIGTRNVAAARAKLRDIGIPIIGEDTGGNRGRTVYFNLDNGEVEVRFAQGRGSLKI